MLDVCPGVCHITWRTSGSSPFIVGLTSCWPRSGLSVPQPLRIVQTAAKPIASCMTLQLFINHLDKWIPCLIRHTLQSLLPNQLPSLRTVVLTCPRVTTASSVLLPCVPTRLYHPSSATAHETSSMHSSRVYLITYHGAPPRLPPDCSHMLLPLMSWLTRSIRSRSAALVQHTSQPSLSITVSDTAAANTATRESSGEYGWTAERRYG